MTNFTKNMKNFTRKLKKFTKNMKIFTKNMKNFTRNMKNFTKNMTNFTRKMKNFTRKLKNFTKNMKKSRGIWKFSRKSLISGRIFLHDFKDRQIDGLTGMPQIYFAFRCQNFATATKIRILLLTAGNPLPLSGHVIVSDVTPRSHERDPEHCRLSQERNTVQRYSLTPFYSLRLGAPMIHEPTPPSKPQGLRGPYHRHCF